MNIGKADPQMSRPFHLKRTNYHVTKNTNCLPANYRGAYGRYLILAVGRVATRRRPLLDASGLSTMIGEPELLYPAWGLFALTAIIAIIALVTIFLYKKRILQIRLCVFNALLILGFYGFFAFLIYSLKGDMEGASVSVKIALSFPLVNLILDYLAIRNIGADEALVRSLDRLR